MWVILKDYIDDRDCFIRSHDCVIDDVNAKNMMKVRYEQRQRLVRELMPIAFRLYDDDDELYYSGYQSRFFGTERGFAPLDDFGMGYAGCTKIKNRNPKTGKWELL